MSSSCLPLCSEPEHTPPCEFGGEGCGAEQSFQWGAHAGTELWGWSINAKNASDRFPRWSLWLGKAEEHLLHGEDVLWHQFFGAGVIRALVESKSEWKFLIPSCSFPSCPGGACSQHLPPETAHPAIKQNYFLVEKGKFRSISDFAGWYLHFFELLVSTGLCIDLIFMYITFMYIFR